MDSLALLGGKPVRTKPFPAPNYIGAEEKAAVMKVMDSGVLSRFLGSWHADFYGGEKVQEFEKAWATYVNAKYAVSVNSAASGLVAAVGAAGIGPGDEVICTPYTMSATPTAIVAYGGVPVFADIDPEIFCLDPESVRARITPQTKAIMVVHLFGHPADMDSILAIAKEHNLIVIEDAAQAPGATYKGRMVGSLGHMTVFSLNYHKHIHTGEGGLVTTNDASLAERLQLIRNHGESVVEEKGVQRLENTFGFNLRLTEIAAAIGIEQLKKLPKLLDLRIQNAEYLSKAIGSLPGLKAPVVRPNCKHAYYVQAFLIDEKKLGVSRERFVKAIIAELPTSPDRDWPLITAGYGKPLYMLPMYQKQIAFGTSGFPFRSSASAKGVNYAAGLCPTTEKIEATQMIETEFLRPPATLEDMKDVVRAFEKVYEQRGALGALSPA